jgi:XTP/dITP diphosphohydrolase
VIAENSDVVKQNWEQIKLKEKGNEKKSVLSGVPQSMPALVKAYRMQEKAAQVGFDWDTKEQVWAKVDEELLEFKEAISDEEKENELGDLLFSLVNYARFSNINPDDALEKTNRKFIKRFNHIEAKAEELNLDLRTVGLAQMDQWWNEAKLIP